MPRMPAAPRGVRRRTAPAAQQSAGLRRRRSLPGGAGMPYTLQRTRPDDLLSIRLRLARPHRATGWGLVLSSHLVCPRRLRRRTRALVTVPGRRRGTPTVMPARGYPALRSSSPFRYSPSGNASAHGVIGRRREVADDGRVGTGVECGAGDDLAEQRRVDAARAGERRQQAAGAQQFERQEVDVLVRARGLLGVLGGRGELGRVDDDQVEARRGVAQPAQFSERVGVAPLRGVLLRARYSGRGSRGRGRAPCPNCRSTARAWHLRPAPPA